ncbi:MAG: HAD family hydrolase [Deltaproteobacteria bacterium]|nr:MAG: HAD family hydrolase [Deltaproteobacteria bacterium]
MNETLFYLQKRSSEFNREVQDLATRKDFQRFLKRVQTSGGGLRGIRKVQGGAWDGWIYRKGEIDQENVVKRIFQEIYLGDQFPSLYGFGPLFHKGEGLYLHERLLISRTVLGALRRKVRMGIASGRPRFEAELALRRFGLIAYFKSAVTLDECHKEEERAKRSTGRRSKRTKPHPYSILRVIREIGIPSPRCAYVGDVVDDMVAARRAREKVEILAIGFAPGGKKDRTAEESLRKVGADMVVRNPQELLQVVERL